MPNVASAGISAARSTSRLLVSQRTIVATHRGLRERSASVRESACVWVGTRKDDEAQVLGVIFHHELADDRATALSLELPEHAKFDLYRRLAATNQSVVALLHTHPAEWVGLSLIDQQNQISSRVGFWSIVLPFYGQGLWSHHEIGFHIRCTRGWRQLSVQEVSKNLVIDHER